MAVNCHFVSGWLSVTSWTRLACVAQMYIMSQLANSSSIKCELSNMVAPWGSKIWSKKAAFPSLIIIVKVLTTNGNTWMISLFSCQLVSSPKSPFNSGLVHDVVVVKRHSGLTRHSGLNWFYTVHLWWVPHLIIMLICTILMCCCSALI